MTCVLDSELYNYSLALKRLLLLFRRLLYLSPRKTVYRLLIVFCRSVSSTYCMDLHIYTSIHYIQCKYIIILYHTYFCIYHHSTQLYISHTRSIVVSTDPRHGFDARSSTDLPEAEKKEMACGSAWIMKQFVYCQNRCQKINRMRNIQYDI